jgi:type II secretory pathway component GspD/PulD (secretin)
MQMTLQPAVSADRRTVQLTLHAKLSDLDTVVPLFPVTTMITPVSEDGAKGQPVPFTQYVQQPHVSTIQIDNAVTVADGGTALLGGWKSTKVMRNEFGPPTLSKIPYVNRLFKNVGYGRESENVILLVTPRIIMHQEEEIRITSGVVQTSATALAQPTSKETACPIADKGCCELAALLDQYHRACSEGRLADASQFAVQALALDPRCFAKCAKECANGK